MRLQSAGFMPSDPHPDRDLAGPGRRQLDDLSLRNLGATKLVPTVDTPCYSLLSCHRVGLCHRSIALLLQEKGRASLLMRRQGLPARHPRYRYQSPSSPLSALRSSVVAGRQDG
jgi:hypothetical protein